MLYSHLDIWERDGLIWHALYRPGTRELSMGQIRPYEIAGVISWAKSHNMKISDKRPSDGFESHTLVGAEPLN